MLFYFRLDKCWSFCLIVLFLPYSLPLLRENAIPLLTGCTLALLKWTTIPSSYSPVSCAYHTSP